MIASEASQRSNQRRHRCVARNEAEVASLAKQTRSNQRRLADNLCKPLAVARNEAIRLPNQSRFGVVSLANTSSDFRNPGEGLRSKQQKSQ